MNSRLLKKLWLWTKLKYVSLKKYFLILKGLNVNNHGWNPWEYVIRCYLTLKGLNYNSAFSSSTPSGLGATNSPCPPNLHSRPFTFNPFGITRRQVYRSSGIVYLTPFTSHHSLITYLFVLLTFFSCQKDPIVQQIDTFPKGVFVTNEGNFLSGNASVSFYNPTEKTVQEKVFETANNQPLGDVLQSMTVIDDKAYLVVNNSQKVEIVSMNDFSSIGTIEGLTSPRFLTPVDAETAYVSDIFGAAISVIDLETQKEMKKIPFGSASEEMVKVGEEMFVAQPSLSFGTKKSSNQLFVINTVSNQVTDSIEVGYSPYALEIDRNNKLWVICNGDFGNPNKLGGIYKINPVTKEVELALPFKDDKVSFAPRLKLNADRSQLYFLKLDIFQLSVDATELPTTPLIEAKGRDLYGLGINPANGNIYVGDSGNFNQQGTVTVHDSTGKELSSFKAGIGVNGFYFN